MTATVRTTSTRWTKWSKAYLEGCEIVYGVRSKRDTDTFFKRFTAESFYKLLNCHGSARWYSITRIIRLISSRALQRAGEIQGGQHFPPRNGAACWIQEHQRLLRAQRARGGKSHYPLSKMLALAFDGITSLSIKPIKMIIGMGVIVGIHQLHRDNLGGGGGYPRKNRNGVGFHNMHYLLPKRSSAHLGGSYRRIHRENLHGSKATSAVHYQRPHLGASRQRRYQLAVHDVRIHKAKKDGFSQKPPFFIELWLYD